MFGRNASMLALCLSLVYSIVFCGELLGQQVEDLRRWQTQLRDPAPSYRSQAAMELSRMGAAAEPALPGLYDRLEDIEPNVRLNAIHAIGSIGCRTTEAASELLETLADPDEHVRYAAEWAMARLALLPAEDADAAQLLVTLRSALHVMETRPHHSRHYRVIEQAIQTLTAAASRHEPAISEPTPEEIARQNWLSEKFAELESIEPAFELSGTVEQLLLIDRLASYEAPDTFPDLQSAIASVRARVLKQAIVRSEFISIRFALERWGTAGEVALRELFDSFPDATQLPDWTAEVISEITPRTFEDISKLVSIANHSRPASPVRAAVITALGHTRDGIEKSAEALLSFLQQSSVSDFERGDILRELGTIAAAARDRTATTPSMQFTVDAVQESLLAVLQDEAQAWAIRLAAANALGNFAADSVEVAHAYVHAARGQKLKDYELRQTVRTMARFGHLAEPGRELVIRALKSDDDLARAAGAEAAQKVCPSTAAILPLLIASACDPSEAPTVKRHAAETIGFVGSDAVGAFAKTIHDSEQLAEEPWAKIEALNALAHLGPNAYGALEQCVSMVEDSRVPLAVRSAAASAIGAMGPQGATAAPALRRLMQAGESAIARSSAIVALAEIGQITTTELAQLKQASNDHVSDVAIVYAAYCLGDNLASEALVHMLDDAPADLAGSALETIGTPANEPLLNVLRDPHAPAVQRVNALRILTRIPQQDYRPLLASVRDEAIGEQCQECLSELFVDCDAKLLQDLVASIRNEENVEARQRLERMTILFAAGAGAGGEEFELTAKSPLVRAFQQDIPRHAEPAQVVLAPTEEPGVLDVSQLISTNPAALPEIPALPTTAVDDDADAIVDSISPETPENPFQPDWDHITGETGSAKQALSNALPLADASQIRDRSVKVFYGTNRVPNSTVCKADDDVQMTSRPSQKLIAILAAVGTIAVCLFGFLRQKSLIYSLFAIAGLGFVIWLGLKNNSFAPPSPPLLAENVEYGGQISDVLSLGVCEVSIPENHVTGELESREIFKFEFQQDESKHVVLRNTLRLDSQTFYRQLGGVLETKGKNLLVFIHGYNVSFEDAARRTAQMSFDLEFPGAPVLYSWPSQANWYQYQLDRKNIELSVGNIKKFLLDLAQKSGAESINLIAHSMGNVGLTAALAEIDASGEEALFNQVVLAAPDIDADIFRTRIAPKIVTKAERCTLYTSKTDLALVASRYFNAGRRAGESVEQIDYPGIDVIDASAVDTSFLGHSYYGGNLSVLQDLGGLLMNQPVQQRTFLRAESTGGQLRWVFQPPYVADQTSSGTPFQLR